MKFPEIAKVQERVRAAAQTARDDQYNQLHQLITKKIEQAIGVGDTGVNINTSNIDYWLRDRMVDELNQQGYNARAMNGSPVLCIKFFPNK
jgi:outer membrane usher protein FimD/PapC